MAHTEKLVVWSFATALNCLSTSFITLCMVYCEVSKVDWPRISKAKSKVTYFCFSISYASYINFITLWSLNHEFQICCYSFDYNFWSNVSESDSSDESKYLSMINHHPQHSNEPSISPFQSPLQLDQFKIFKPSFCLLRFKWHLLPIVFPTKQSSIYI